MVFVSNKAKAHVWGRYVLQKGNLDPRAEIWGVGSPPEMNDMSKGTQMRAQCFHVVVNKLDPRSVTFISIGMSPGETHFSSDQQKNRIHHSVRSAGVGRRDSAAELSYHVVSLLQDDLV